MPTRSRHCCTISLSRWLGRRGHLIWEVLPNITTSLAVRGKCQLSCSRCGTYAKGSCFRPFSLFIVICPEVGSSNPAMTFNKVLFPAPFGPTIPTNVPDSTEKLMLSRMWFASRYKLISDTSRMGALCVFRLNSLNFSLVISLVIIMLSFL